MPNLDISLPDKAALRAMLLAHRNCTPLAGVSQPRIEDLAARGYVELRHGEWWLTALGRAACGIRHGFPPGSA
jgi:hypothetical protein